ncbi:MAG: glycosyltransferase [Oligoflexia bacterium]|nr:glycosyltransferase [Oligoflexia bacterium]
MKIGIIIPCYNFSHQIEKTFERITNWKNSSSHEVSLCFVDDGSSDQTFEKISQFAKTNEDWVFALKAEKNMGKGHSIKLGFRALENKVEKVLFTDCDLHYGTQIFNRFIDELEEYEIVIADRSWTASSTHQAISRKTSSYVFNRLTGLLTGVIFRDSQAGMKGFQVNSCRSLFKLSKINGFAFDVEILSIALSYRYKIKQIPVKFDKNEDLPQTSSIKLIRDSIKMVFELARINYYARFSFYHSDELEQKVDKEIFKVNYEH